MNGTQTTKYLVVVAVIAAAALGFFFWPKTTDLTPSPPPPPPPAHITGDVIVETPKNGALVQSPLLVKGKARGNWFFEASFPIFIVDWDGKIIAQSHAEAVLDPNNPESTWMTTEFVEFQGIIEFPRQNMPNDFLKRGAIIFHNDNPSGLPENDKALEIPILFGE